MSNRWQRSSITLSLCRGAGFVAAMTVSSAGADEASAARSLLLFSISKSENKNQVQYAVRVDGGCQPLASAPVVAYWRMLEKGPAATEPLLEREIDAYGIAEQTITSRMADGASVRLVLRAVRSRPIVVEVYRTPTGECQALSTTTIQGAPAHLYNVYVKLKWPFGVDYLLLQGWSVDGTQVVKEKLAR
jgi:hypothetical protein